MESAEGRTDAVIDPATGEPMAEVAASGTEDVDRAVEAASAAFDEWAAVSPATRARVAQRIR